jgi:ABC-type amino acid transport substrate-binding protein
MIRGFLLAVGLLVAYIFIPSLTRFRPRVTDAITGKPSGFVGLAARFRGTPIRNDVAQIGQEKIKHLRVLHVHGMGTPSPLKGYSLPFATQLADKLGMRFKETTEKDLLLFNLPFGARSPFLRISTYVDDQGRSLAWYELSWYPLIQDIKQAKLGYDSVGTSRRAPINQFLKKNLMNERLADPVLYLGLYGAPIRTAVKQSICIAMGGSLTTVNAKERCADLSVPEDTGLAIVTRSLGSKITFDAISELRGDDPAAAEQLAAKTTGVYFLANQLPLLELAEEGRSRVFDLSAVSTVLQNFVALRARRADAVAPTIEFVAISDPNDLLSYALPPTKIDGAHLVNVSARIGREFGLGIVANPLQAHTGHTDNAQVRGLLINGYTAKAPL